MGRLCPDFVQLDGGSVEADGHCPWDLQDEPGAGGTPQPALTGRVAMPRAAHAEMRPKLEALVEANEEVLAEGLDRLDPGADEQLRTRARPAGGGRRHRPSDQEWSDARRDAMERIALRHGAGG